MPEINSDALNYPQKFVFPILGLPFQTASFGIKAFMDTYLPAMRIFLKTTRTLQLKQRGCKNSSFCPHFIHKYSFWCLSFPWH